MSIENTRKFINKIITCTLKQLIVDLQIEILNEKKLANNIPGLEKAITILDAYVKKHNYM